MKYRLSDNTEITISPDVVSSRIRNVIEKSELSYYQLEELTGIPKSAIQRYATGQTKKIPDGRIFAIARATRTSPFYILGQTDIMEEEHAMGGLHIYSPPKPPYDLAIEKDGKLIALLELTDKMSEEQIKHWLNYGEFLISQKEE